MSEPNASAAPRLLLVVPCLNEAAHLPNLLTWLARDSAVYDALIVVADGGASDRAFLRAWHPSEAPGGGMPPSGANPGMPPSDAAGGGSR